MTTSAVGSALEWVLRSLLRLRRVEETERVVLDLVRATSAAGWAGLYVLEDGAYVRRRCSPEPQATLAETIQTGPVEAVVQSGRGPVVCPPDAALRGEAGQDVDVVAPLPLGGGETALILLGPRPAGPFGPPELGLLDRVVDACAVALRNAHELERLESQVYLDFLTGCYNRRAFENHLKVEIGRARRYERPLSLLLLDIDHFKWVNDTMGHPAGDHALRRVGEFLSGEFRGTDWVCRYGGDEFAVIFPETPKDEVVRLAERIRMRLSALFPDEVVRRSVTGSVGVASCPSDGLEPELVLKAADRALYRAKASGRNRVVAA